MTPPRQGERPTKAEMEECFRILDKATHSFFVGDCVDRDNRDTWTGVTEAKRQVLVLTSWWYPDLWKEIC